MRSYTSLPTEDGLQLWLVHFMGSYYDNDPRGSGTEPIDGRYLVIARTRAEALQKAQPMIDAIERNYPRMNSKPELIVRPYTLEELVPARNSRHDGRMGYHSMTRVTEVDLTLDEDKQHFRLAVCLIDERQE